MQFTHTTTTTHVLHIGYSPSHALIAEPELVLVQLESCCSNFLISILNSRYIILIKRMASKAGAVAGVVGGIATTLAAHFVIPAVISYFDITSTGIAAGVAAVVLEAVIGFVVTGCAFAVYQRICIADDTGKIFSGVVACVVVCILAFGTFILKGRPVSGSYAIV